jgi:DNA polymerase-3 subunit epsilon
MTRFANERRYEEAAWLRDRHDALARAIERKHRWQALTEAGFLEIEDAQGRRTVIDHGALVETRRPGDPPGLIAQARPADVSATEVPPNCQAGEEAEIIWRWLTGTSVRLVEATGRLALPTRRVVRLNLPSRRAA